MMIVNKKDEEENGNMQCGVVSISNNFVQLFFHTKGMITFDQEAEHSYVNK